MSDSSQDSPSQDVTMPMNMPSAPAEKKEEAACAPANPDVTLCITTTGGDTGQQAEETATVNLKIDDSLDFRRSLEKLGKRYKFLKKIAEGGFGRIFLVEDQVLGREIVIKSLKEEHLPQTEDVQKFIAEAKLNAQLAHPSVVPLYSLNSDSIDGLHLSMQLINGITLKDYLKQCHDRLEKTPTSSRRYRQELQSRLESFLKVCEAIDYCHSKGIIHCDLKPENIMIGEHGEVYVMDWGIACPAGTNRKGHLYGTPSYTAPETFQDGSTNQKTDIFALGMILNGIVTLRPPVAGASVQETVTKIRLGQFEPSIPENPHVRISADLRAIIAKARAVDPAERYDTVKELADDIRHYLFNEEVSAHPDSPPMKLLRFMSRHRQASLLTLAAVLCISAFLALYGERRLRDLSTQVNTETVRRMHVQARTDELAADIDKQLQRFRDKLNELSTGFAIAKESGAPQGDGKPRILLVDEFAAGSRTRPQDLVASPLYAEEISLGCASYWKPGTMTQEEMLQCAKPLLAIQPQAMAMLWDGMGSSKAFSLEAARRHLLSGGTFLRHITILLSNGVAMRYPGMHEKVASPFNFVNDWFREKQQRREEPYPWTTPYPDTSGHPVVTCWTIAKDPNGRKIGQIGFELDFRKLVTPLQHDVNIGLGGSNGISLLVDSEGNVLFSTGEQDSRLNPGQPSLDINQLPLLPWISRYHIGNLPQFLDKLPDGTLKRISLAAIPDAGWTLVRILPPNVYNRINQEMDDWERSVIETDIRLERELLIQ